MALPQIQESDPWLEVDEEDMEECVLAHKKAHEKFQEQKRSEQKSMTGTVTTLAKISIYTYLLFRVLSKSSVARLLLTQLKHFAGKYQSISSILFILAFTLLGSIKR